MRRAIARGRMLPQSLSTDPRMGRLSLKAVALFPLMWANCDDQGRLSGDPDEIKYAVCPAIEHITKADIPELLKELETQGFIKVYTTSKTKAVQMLDWWEEQKLQWAYPSRYPPPEGWTDHLRYHPTPKEIITENWPSGQHASELLPSKLPSAPPKEPANLLPSKLQETPLTTPIEKEGGKRRGRGRLPSALPSALGSRPPPSPAPSQKEILEKLLNCHKTGWGKLPGARISAQLRDLSQELSAAGCPLDYIEEAFREAAGQNKYSVSYVRAILLDWLGVGRGPPDE